MVSHLPLDLSDNMANKTELTLVKESEALQKGDVSIWATKLFKSIANIWEKFIEPAKFSLSFDNSAYRVIVQVHASVSYVLVLAYVASF